VSITVRIWSKEELEKIGKDMELTTIFLNGSTFSAEEIKHYPYHLRKTYIATWWGNDEEVKFYATDDEMAKWFLSQEYTTLPAWLVEETRNYREVAI